MKPCFNNEIPQATYLGEVVVDTLTTLPDYLLAERDIADEKTGNVVRTLTRIPTGRIVPNGNYDNVTSIETNNPSFTVPEGQVVAAYVKNEANTVRVYKTDASHKAQFIAIGNFVEGQILIQNCGVINIPEGHSYIIGQTYYTGVNGEPTTNTASGQKLFTPISRTQLLVQL